MKWVLYAVATVAIVLGFVVIFGAFGVFQETAGLIILLVGTSSLGFAVVVGRLDRLAKRD